jgi:hypothetical protein
MGMRIAAVLNILWCISWVVDAGMLARSGPLPNESGGAVWTFIVLSIIISCTQLISPFLQIRWLISDNIETRKGVVLGYKAHIIATFIVGGWYIVGAYIILRAPFHVYLVRTFREYWGFDENGDCP